MDFVKHFESKKKGGCQRQHHLDITLLAHDNKYIYIIFNEKYKYNMLQEKLWNQPNKAFKQDKRADFTHKLNWWPRD